ncbi:Uncharacterized protein TPAR_03254 [Tolypocladium paradoxum]|uniref:C2H2-type domain-containing protein n=1 Tax=Tolypocladium paradoxum TaxID=94208 RepID=A0A2S4L2B5_9HYPO|nr:Uncharacterized protein TPAR_03254 [Tolypocladium paradoxum]
MASTFAAVPGSLDSQGRDHLQSPEPRNLSPPASGHRRLSTPAVDVDDLSRLHSESVSPSANQFETPAGSTTTLGNYQSSDFSDLDEDPFFGADFSNIEGGTPSFLDAAAGWNQPAFLASDSATLEPRYEVDDGTSYPLTPHTASIYTTSPRSERKDTITRPIAHRLPDSISPQQLQKPFKPAPVVVESSDFTPSHSSSNRTSEDGLAPAPVAMNPQSPRVTVSVWDQDDNAPVHTVERTFEDSPSTVRGGIHSAGDLISSAHEPNFASAHRDSLDRWHSESTARRGGLDPRSRPSDEIPSINEVMTRRNVEDRNQEVGKWLSGNLDDVSAPREESAEEIRALEQSGYDSNDGIPSADATENRYVPGQTYYNEECVGQMNDVDRDIIAANRNWADAPVLHQITMGTPGRNQPQSSQAAIERFERLCRDNDSIISRSATWGTRRRSHPSIFHLDMEGVTSGGFLKKLSLSRGSGDKSNKSGSLLRDLRGLVRRPSASSLRKRSRSRSRSRGAKDAESPYQQDDDQQVKRDNTPHLSPPSRTSSWGKKPPTPSINTALVNMAQHMASIGTTHSRSGSISGTTPMASPRNSLTSSLSVKNTLRRPRSKSEIPKPSAAAVHTESHPNLIGMWKKSGGPPVASLTKTSNINADDDDDDDDDEPYEDNDMKANPNIIDAIAPNFAGFQQHVETLNPGLGATHGYLVDRIAHQQIIRYKLLLNAKVKHLGLGANCACGSLCIAMGGSANVLDQKGDPRGVDPLSAQLNDPDEGAPTEGVINQESFPQDIPMPPTQYLPAEFECQLCYQRKKFQKPSDWTKHVHEDVQPFTCTWDKCRDPKMFKRKADWVRHENEGHRHLEWWTCDVDDCRHTCYRRDNFLQHLVREHKFLEPKVKTKAAMKRAGGMDPTWQKVEQCHIETSTRPQEEPCRFCGKVFPTWKKLTVHLAKHMEQISLPVLRLVAAKAKELAADTIISPVQDPPPRPMIPLPNQTAPALQYPGVAQQQQHQFQPGHQHMSYPNQSHFMYPVMAPGQYQQQQQQPFYAPQYNNMGQSLQQPALGVGQMNQGYDPNQRMQGLPNTSDAFVPAPNPYMAMNDNEVEPFPELNALGLQNVGDGQLGGQLGYDAIMDPSSVNGSPFSGHESRSTYSHSPHQNASSNKNQEQTWEGRRLTGFP